jgi:UDP-N-acetylglucosamine 1-carboxyvinyltransferase
MEQLIITGKTPEDGLRGTVRISGSKNASLPVMAAVLLTEGPTFLGEVPHLTDVETMRKLLAALGVASEWIEPNLSFGFSRTGKRVMRLELIENGGCEAPVELAMQMRASICVLGPLVARYGEARVPLPGGCVIGQRPIDLHIKGLEALGAEVRMEKGYVCASAKRLKGTRIYLGGPHGSTVLGTSNVMMAATLAEGTTIIDHAACEPEVQDLAHYLNACGANITGIGTSTLVIEGIGGRSQALLKGCMHTVIPDRIEAGTFACAAAITGGDIILEGVRPDHMTAVIDRMKDMGVKFEAEQPHALRRRRAKWRKAPGQAELPASGAWRATNMRVWREGPLKGVDFATHPYPGVPTDMQPQLMATLCIAEGTSVITDNIYPERFTHVADLTRLGAQISKGSQAGQAVVRGPARLSSANVTAQDLRGGAGLILAALAAEGETTVSGIEHVDRGYEAIEHRLSQLGAKIRRVSCADASAEQRRAAS